MKKNTQNSGVVQDPPEIDRKIMPVMREAITMVQMVLYKQLQSSISSRYEEWRTEEQQRLAGAVVNNLFGTEPLDKEVVVFAKENRELVEKELHAIAELLQPLCPYLTDALRMKTICDNQEGTHSIPSLLMAKALGVLQEERVLPMPSTFMLSVRTLAQANGLVEPIKVAPPEE